MSLHVTQFYQAFPRVSTANDKCWGEKAWVRGHHCPLSVCKTNVQNLTLLGYKHSCLSLGHQYSLQLLLTVHVSCTCALIILDRPDDRLTSVYQPAECFTHGRLVGLCVPTYMYHVHMHNNCIVYIVAMRPYFNQLW